MTCSEPTASDTETLALGASGTIFETKTPVCTVCLKKILTKG